MGCLRGWRYFEERCIEGWHYRPIFIVQLCFIEICCLQFSLYGIECVKSWMKNWKRRGKKRSSADVSYRPSIYWRDWVKPCKTLGLAGHGSEVSRDKARVLPSWPRISMEQLVESGLYAKSNFSAHCFTSLVSHVSLKRLLCPRFFLQAVSNNQVIWYIIRDFVRPGFPGTVWVLWFPKNSVPMSCRISSGTPNVPGYSKPVKYDISDNACEYCEFPTVGGKRLQE
jgi:hypothetical protein